MKTAETTARAARYGVGGIPHVVVDGQINEIGADVCATQAGTYRNDINGRLSATGGQSPIKITGDLSVVGTTATITAHFEQVDPGTFTAHQGTLFIYEDNISWCCGYGGVSEWNGAVRMVRSTPVSLTGVGQIVDVVQVLDTTVFTTPPCNPANLHAAAVFELVGGLKTVIQSSDLIPLDFNWNLANRVQSVPAGNGVALFTGTVQNIGEVADLVTLSVDAGFGWPTDYQIEGDATWYTSHNLALNAGESKEITLRVQTDSVERIGEGTLSAQSANTGRVSGQSARVFNGDYAILLVDDDNNQAWEQVFVTDMNAVGRLFDTVSGSAGLSDMLGYDAVIWQTGYMSSSLLSQEEIDGLMAYMDQDGRLFLSSLDFLSTQSSATTFLTDYLGVASWTSNTKANTETGVTGDPITAGMLHTLTWPAPSANRTDSVTPVAGAQSILTSDITGAPNAIRFETVGGARSVFSTITQNVFSPSAPDPNNSKVLLDKILTWLLEGSTTDVIPGTVSNATRILGATPNPFMPSTELRFAISPTAAREPVSLVVVDAAGREVRNLISGSLEAGSHQIVWDGADAKGRPAAAGLYFARLRSSEGETSAKVIRVR